MEKRGLRGRGKEEVDQKKGLQVEGKGKGKVDEGKRGSKNDEREDGGREQWVEVDIRHCCTLDAICALNDQLSDVQKESVRGMVWNPVLEYRSFLIDRHLVQALLHSWNLEDKCFKLGHRDVPFSQFDVALLTGLPATGKRVTFERSEGGSEVEEVLKGTMDERVAREKQRRRTSQKDVCIYRNYISVLLELCKVNTVETVLLFKKPYTLLVVSGLLFLRRAGGVAWELVHIVEDVDGVGGTIGWKWCGSFWCKRWRTARRRCVA